MVEHIGGINGAMGNISTRKIKQAYQQQNTSAKINDTVEISNDVMTVRGVDKIRLDKIMEIRQQIQDGTYMTDQKLDSALDRALDDALQNF